MSTPTIFESFIESFIESINSSISSESTPTFIFVDGSYYLFHRYYSMIRWYKYNDETVEDPIQNPSFVDKFKKTFVNNLKTLSQNLGISDEIKPIMIVGRDCPRENIWRNSLQDNYKANRKNGSEDGFMGGPFFKMAYKEKLFQEGGAKAILSHPKLEADDCIAISVKYLLEKYLNVKIYIITSDKDYLQLIEPRVQIFDMSFKNIALKKSSTGDAQTDLFCKIVMGDISDNISSVLTKCGPKTALKCYQDKAYFNERMTKENAFKKFEINQKMVDFNYIPQELQDEFLASITV